MKTLQDPVARRDSVWRTVSVALAALLVGTLIGPGAAAAASSAWVRVKNWPAVQKVLITNPASAPAYTQPPAHTIVNLRGGATIQNAAATNVWGSPFYTVPADKWLVITQMRCEGYGSSAISFISLSSYTNIHEVFPITLVYDNGTYNVSSNVTGPMYVPPGTALYLAAVRNTSGTGLWNVSAYADGYLTDRP